MTRVLQRPRVVQAIFATSCVVQHLALQQSPSLKASLPELVGWASCDCNAFYCCSYEWSELLRPPKIPVALFSWVAREAGPTRNKKKNEARYPRRPTGFFL